MMSLAATPVPKSPCQFTRSVCGTWIQISPVTTTPVISMRTEAHHQAAEGAAHARMRIAAAGKHAGLPGSPARPAPRGRYRACQRSARMPNSRAKSRVSLRIAADSVSDGGGEMIAAQGRCGTDPRRRRPAPSGAARCAAARRNRATGPDRPGRSGSRPGRTVVSPGGPGEDFLGQGLRHRDTLSGVGAVGNQAQLLEASQCRAALRHRHQAAGRAPTDTEVCRVEQACPGRDPTARANFSGPCRGPHLQAMGAGSAAPGPCRTQVKGSVSDSLQGKCCRLPSNAVKHCVNDIRFGKGARTNHVSRNPGRRTSINRRRRAGHIGASRPAAGHFRLSL